MPNETDTVDLSELYSGSVRIEFRPHAKRGRYKVFQDGEQIKPAPPSVTTITSILDVGKSNALSAWAARCVIDIMRERIKPDEIHGQQFLEEAFKDAQNNYRDIKQKAADVGTLAHAALERRFKEPDFAPPLRGTPVRALYDSALDWFSQGETELISAETKVYSRKYKTVGTLDNLCKRDSIPSIIDFKASKSIYPAYLLQIAAYANMYEEEHSDIKIEQAWILQLSENGAKPYKYNRKQLDLAYNSFLALRQVYEWNRSLGTMKSEQKDWLDL